MVSDSGVGWSMRLDFAIQWLIIGNIASIIYQTKELSEYGYWFGGIFLVAVGLTYLIENRHKIGTIIMKYRYPI